MHVCVHMCVFVHVCVCACACNARSSLPTDNPAHNAKTPPPLSHIKQYGSSDMGLKSLKEVAVSEAL